MIFSLDGKRGFVSLAGVFQGSQIIIEIYLTDRNIEKYLYYYQLGVILDRRLERQIDNTSC